MRLFIVALLVCCFSAPAIGATATADQFNADLSSLEDRFFMHEYSNETPDQRLDRLDQLVFGRVRQGPTDERMTSLLLAVPNVQAQSVQTSTQSTPQAAPALEAERPQVASSPPPPATVPESQSSPVAANAQPAQSNNGASVDYYPSVTALEQEIAHKTEQTLPLPQRLAKLETIAFGKPSTSNDLSKRVDRLKEYVSQKNGGNENYLTSSNAVGMGADETGLVAEVSSMEQQVFGQTYGRDDLSNRITRLEKNLLPKQPSTDVHTDYSACRQTDGGSGFDEDGTI